MWIKYWTVGNGGMSGEVNIAEIYDGADNDEIEKFIKELDFSRITLPIRL